MKFLFTTFTLALFCTMHVKSQINYTAIEHAKNWCSEIASIDIPPEKIPQENRVKISCYDYALMFSKGYSFVASSNQVEIRVKFRERFGSIKRPKLVLLDQNKNELKCEVTDPYKDDVLLYANVKKGSTYYFIVSIDNHPDYLGNFTLCLSNAFSYDYPLGARDIKSTTHFCTQDPFISTLGSNREGPTPSCLEKGPNYNRWFSFKAKTSNIEITVTKTPVEGNFESPFLTLYDENLKELTCSEATTVVGDKDKLIYNSLGVNKKYYLAVDHLYNNEYLGSFELCFDDFSNQDAYYLSGILKDKSGHVQAQKKVVLKEENKEAKEIFSDDKGHLKVKLNALPKDNQHLITLDNTDLQLDLVIQDANQKPVLRSKNTKDGQVSVKKPQAECNRLILFDCLEKQEVDVVLNKKSILGKVVDKKDFVSPKKGINYGLYDHKLNKVQTAIADHNGHFSFTNLPRDQTYLVRSLEENNHALYTEIIEVNDQKEIVKTATSHGLDENGFFHFQRLPREKASITLINTKDVSLPILSGLKKDQAVVLKNVYFKKASSQLFEDSYAELDILFSQLMKSKNIRIKISGHSDNTGDFNYNLVLSEKRAQRVAEYLIKKGISKSRVSYQGYGQSKPIADNTSKKGRMQNRRVDFTIVN